MDASFHEQKELNVCTELADTQRRGPETHRPLLSTPKKKVTAVAIGQDKKKTDRENFFGFLWVFAVLTIVAAAAAFAFPLLDGNKDIGSFDFTVLVGGLVVGLLASVLSIGKVQ